MFQIDTQRWHPLFWWLWAVAGSTLLISNSQRRPIEISIFSVATIFAALILALRTTVSVHAKRMLRFGYGLAIVALIFRITIAILIGVPIPGKVLFALPEISLPSFLVGINLGGPVTSQRLISALAESLLFAAIVILFATANAFTTPHRLLRVLPNRLRGLGVATSIATSVAPQSADSLARVRFAHRIRGRKVTGIKSIRRIALPVLEESLERSIQLAIAMESRGYGYFVKPTRYRPERWRLEESALVFALVLLVIVSNLPLSSSAIIAIALFYFLLAPGLFK